MAERVRTEAFGEAIAIMARLRGPGGCPWDRAQTFASIRRHTLEETYEVFDAIEREAWGELKDELGDLLLQVLFYAQMAEEAGYFSIEEVAAGLSAKLIRRHPHIFAGEVAETPEDVKVTWEAVKARERAGKAAAPAGLLEEVSRHQPALAEAAKLGKKAAAAGFDWPHAAGLIDKLEEETAELEAEVVRVPRVRAAMEEELGDLLFTAVNLARHLELEPEFALRKANAKFRGRFAAMESAAGSAEKLKKRSAEELEELWRAVKERNAEDAEEKRAEDAE